jgi:hypothetical protein
MPATWSGGRQLMSRGLHAGLVQAPGRAAELVALRAAPMLSEDAANAVATAPEAGPHRDPGGHERLDGAQGQLVADEGDGLQQDEVGRMVLEGARQELDELAPGGAVDVAVDREGEGHLVLASGLLDGLAADLDAAARDVHPVQGSEVPGALGLHLGGEAPRVGRDDVAALIDVAAVHVAHDVGVVGPRPTCPRAPRRARARRRAADARARWRCLRRGSRSARPSAAPRCAGTPAPARGPRPGPTRPAARSCRPFSTRGVPASPLRG